MVVKQWMGISSGLSVKTNSLTERWYRGASNRQRVRFGNTAGLMPKEDYVKKIVLDDCVVTSYKHEQ